MNRTNTLAAKLEKWLIDYNDAPWRRYVAGLAARDELAVVDGVMIDTAALFKTKFHCDSRRCAAPNRAAGTESCCTDYDVEITPAEQARIVERAPEVLTFLAHREPDRFRSERQLGEFFETGDVIQLAKHDRRCAFSYRDAEGRLWCGLHSLAAEKNWPIGDIKPLACILFPLVISRFDNGEILLTAVSAQTERLFDGPRESGKLPCLAEKLGPPMYVECRSAIEFGFGAEFYRHLVDAAESFNMRAPN